MNKLAQAVPAVMDPPADLTKLEDIFSNVLNIALALGGIALFIMLLVGGFGYITAGGDAKKAAGAQQTITWAVLGLVLLASSYLILRLIAQFTGLGDAILIFKIQGN
jgi:hypothetical protein